MPYVAERFAIWHVPKCGGTWVRDALRAGGVPVDQIEPQHATPSELPELRANRQQAVTVRHPLDWYWSAYCHFVHHFQIRPDDPSRGSALWWRFGLSPEELFPFARFIERHAGNYTRILKGYLAGLQQVKLLRTQQIADDLVRWFSELSIKHDADAIRCLPPRNVTAQAGRWWEEPHWTESLRAEVIKLDWLAVQLSRRDCYGY